MWRTTFTEGYTPRPRPTRRQLYKLDSLGLHENENRAKCGRSSAIPMLMSPPKSLTSGGWLGQPRARTALARAARRTAVRLLYASRRGADRLRTRRAYTADAAGHRVRTARRRRWTQTARRSLLVVEGRLRETFGGLVLSPSRRATMPRHCRKGIRRTRETSLALVSETERCSPEAQGSPPVAAAARRLVCGCTSPRRNPAPPRPLAPPPSPPSPPSRSCCCRYARSAPQRPQPVG